MVIFMAKRRRVIWPVAVCAALAMAACAPVGTAPVAVQPTATGGQGQDVERPDLFNVTDRGLWDGRPSLGGVWVAHPDVVDPERVIVRNAANGRSVVAALFRRERANPGPVLQVSSDAASALWMLAGSPAQLQVTALRRSAEPAAAPAPAAPTPAAPAPAVTAAAPAPAPVPTAAAPAAPARAATARAAAAAPTTPAPAPVAQASATPDAGTGFMVQIGTFASQDSAETAIARLRAAGFAADSRMQRVSGRDRFVVTSGPVANQAGLDQIRALGFDNASRLAEPPAPGAVPAPAPAGATTAPATQPPSAPDAVAASPSTAADALVAQVGVFSVQNNADAAAARLRAAGFTATVTPRTSRGQSLWAVTATGLDGPAALGRIKALGFADAFIPPNK